jgi:hypothetical protein
MAAPWIDSWQPQLYYDGWFGAFFSVDPDSDTPEERTRYILALVDTFIVAAATRTFECHEGKKMIKFPYKDPDEVDDYKLDWTARLAPLSDEIATSDWSIVTDMGGEATPLAIEDGTIKTLTSTTVWLSAGVLTNSYQLLNRITTTGGRTLDQTCTLVIKTR